MYAIDLHCDTMSKLAERGRTSLLRENDLNVDIAKLQAGNFAAQFFALFVDMAKTNNPLEYCLQMVDRQCPVLRLCRIDTDRGRQNVSRACRHVAADAFCRQRRQGHVADYGGHRGFLQYGWRESVRCRQTDCDSDGRRVDYVGGGKLHLLLLEY